MAATDKTRQSFLPGCCRFLSLPFDIDLTTPEMTLGPAQENGDTMKKVLIYGLGTLVTLLAVLFISAALQPREWALERSVLIDAPREQVWSVVSDLNRYGEWNSYARHDPEVKIAVEGPAASLGSSYSWDGPNIGKGRLITKNIQDGERIDFGLEFIRPMEVTNESSFVVDTQGDLTKMTWIMKGTHEGMPGLIARAIHLFVSMDEMVGKDFEAGLGMLKELIEKEKGHEPA
jgi:uncharacterized protein YndB with AHSA1/START domain